MFTGPISKANITVANSARMRTTVMRNHSESFFVCIAPISAFSIDSLNQDACVKRLLVFCVYDWSPLPILHELAS
jgi:hypothetical protein